MEIKHLSKEVITKLRSSSNINNLTQCVTELVLNSLDANSSAVAIRLNSMSFRIQVIDNGIGISQENLDKIGKQYYTNKCQSLADLNKRPTTYGCKGESLWSISNISKIVNITSKNTKCENTFTKNICARKHGHVAPAKKRQSNGTTITIDGFFHNLPVRQKRTKREFEFDELVNFLEKMSIIHPQVSITLRDDITGKLLFKRPKSENIIKSLADLYPEVKYDETIVMKVHKDKITVEALLSKDIFKDKQIQHIYVNKRPVYHQKLQTFICRELARAKKEQLHLVENRNPMFIMNIKCTLPNFNVLYENSEAKVEFLNVDLIYRCIEKLITSFLGKSKPIEKVDEFRGNKKSICGVSDLVGTVKGLGFKNWLKKDEVNERESGIIEEVLEQNDPIEVPQPPKKPNICATKNNKLKSLPIKINERKNDKHKKAENTTKKNNEHKDNLQEDNNFIVPVAPNKTSVENVMMKNFRKLEKNCRNITSKLNHDDTLFSHFTNTEEKGKDLIMYMFLKSTELFNEYQSEKNPTRPTEENSFEQCNSSRETIMESNIFFENVTRTKTHQLNKTISVSVRLKRRKHFEEKPHFPEISFSIPTHKKRRIEYLNGRVNLKEQENQISPYFKNNKVDNHPNIRNKKHVDRKIQVCFNENFDISNNITLWNSFVNGDKMRSDIFCGKELDNKNFENYSLIRSKHIEQRFDEMPVFNDCFLKFNQDKKLSYDGNRSYFFNFESTSIINNNLANDLQFNTNLPLGNDLINKLWTNDTRYNFKNTVLQSFDFENLPLSPIPKFQNSPREKNLNKLELCEPPAKLTKHASEGNVVKVSSPYFSKERSKYKSINYDNFLDSLKNDNSPQQNENQIMGNFRRYHTEPLQDSRLEYIQNVKKNIDKIFSSWKNEKNKKYARKERETEIFTVDSLERENNKHECSQHKQDKKYKTPLWKKFVDNKCKQIKVRDRLRKKSTRHSRKKISEIEQQTSKYFEKELISAPQENLTPDLFSNTEYNPMNVPEKDLTFLPNSAVSCSSIDGKNVNLEKDVTTLTAVPASSNLIITLDVEEGKNGVKINAEHNMKVGVGNIATTDDEWIKKNDQDGNEFFLNKRTGFTSFFHPKKEEVFNFKQRPEFMPKGMSPLLVPDKKIEKILSPISKEKLHDEILRSCVDDSDLIKWEKCMNGYDPKQFFENLYNERVNEYEKEVPNIIGNKVHSKFTLNLPSDHKFSKMLFSNLEVIGQIDQKFITTIDKKNFDLILFDQHAVHERIRLEDLMKEYNGKSSTCENVTLFMNQPDVELLHKNTQYLNGIGINFRNFKNGIIIYEVPLCLLNKVTKEFPLQKLLQQFIRQLLELARNTRGVLTGLPTMMNEIINMEACRGAVKFGESLRREEMRELIDKLSRCILPFQCAHGRPTLIPLLNLNVPTEEIIYKPNLRCLIKK